MLVNLGECNRIGKFLGKGSKNFNKPIILAGKNEEYSTYFHNYKESSDYVRVQ